VVLGEQAPASTPTGEPPPPAPATPPLPVSAPFDVVLDVVHVGSMDNDELFGRQIAIPDDAVAAATAQIGRALGRYLDAAFIAPQTRFSERPLAALLNRRALTALSDDDLAGLGALGIAVERVEPQPVTAKARVLTSGSDVAVVTVRYDARAQVVTHDGASVPLRQRATMVFVPDRDGWLVAAVDANLDLPLAAHEVAR
jgi:hypothetical protein